VVILWVCGLRSLGLWRCVFLDGDEDGDGDGDGDGDEEFLGERAERGERYYYFNWVESYSSSSQMKSYCSI
jgi:hypothetical protein